MKGFWSARLARVSYAKYVLAVAAAWTLTIGGSFLWNLSQERDLMLEVARVQARATHAKDVLYRRWSSEHGGVYVPVTEATPPNPHLAGVVERDVTTPAGTRLTLLNPAYMTRQIHELAERASGIRGHITSLKPIRPENAPDPWEARALAAFERGEAEVSSLERFAGEEYLRLMRPLVSESGCLKCHAGQGDREGQIRGGISVSVPMRPLREIEERDIRLFGEAHLLLYLSGLGGIGLVCVRLRRNERARAAAEERVRASEQRYRELADLLPQPVFETDLQGRLTFVNRSAFEVFGYRPEEFTEELTALQMVAPADQARATEGIRQALTGDRGTGREYLCRRKDGEIFPALITSAPIMREGSTIGLRGIIVDISDRVQAETALADRTRQLEVVRAVTAEITRELDLSALLGLINRRTVELARADSGAVYLWDEVEQALRPWAWVGYGDWMRTVRVRLGEGAVGTVAESRAGLAVHDYRNSRYALPTFLERTAVSAVVAEPLLYQERLLGVITAADHTTERRFSPRDRETLALFAAHAAIAIQNARLHEEAVRRGVNLDALLGATRTILADLDLPGLLERIVAEGARIAGTPHVKVRLLDEERKLLRLAATVGTPMSSGQEGSLSLGYSARVVQSGRPLFVPDTQADPENAFRERDRAMGIRTYLGLPLLARGEVRGVLSFNTTDERRYTEEEMAFLASFADQAALAIENARLFSELTDSYQRIQRAQAELLRAEKLRSLGRMAAGIAHDLNNMLAAVMGQAELLRLRATDPGVHEGLTTLLTAATDGAHVVRRLQDFARQRTKSPLSPCNLPELVRQALDLTRPRWKDEQDRRGTSVAIEVTMERCPPVLGHPSEIREVILNLILNALDAMPQGGALAFRGRMVEASPGREEEEVPPAPSTTRPAGRSASWVELAISDTGIGMSEEIRQRIFDPFFTTKGVQGTGLGLSVAYGIMERHGGSIDVRSAPEAGTTFLLRFQAAAAEVRAPAGPVSPPPAPRRILLIDDDLAVRKTLSELLRAVGHAVVEAEGGVAGLKCLGTERVDLVLTDLGMPDLTGWEVARQIRSSHPGLPIILLTGWGEQIEATDERCRLVDRIAGKPVRLQELTASIAELTTARAPSAG
jgi:PAS domain S-box-containing protein